MNATTRGFTILKVVPSLAFGLMLAACGANGSSSDTNSASPPPSSNIPPAGDPVSFSASNYSVSQGAGFVVLAVNRSGTSDAAINVSYATTSGTAIPGTDYSTVTGQLLWADGDTTPKTISVPISNAAPYTGSKSFTVALSNPSADAAISTPDTATVTISGDAASNMGNLQLADSSYAITQGASASLTVTVSRNLGSTGIVSVSYATSNGTAIAGTDYTAIRGTLKWANGDATAKTFSIPISSKTPFSGTKVFNVTLSDVTGGALLGSPSSAAVTITGNKTAAVGTVHLSAASYGITQGASIVNITVDRTGGTGGAVSVAYATSNGAAVSGKDYTAASGKLQWADGDGTAKTFSVTISNATPFTGTKAFTVALSEPTGGAAVSSPGNATVTITGDAPAAAEGDVQFSAAAYTVTQSAGSIVVTADRTGGSSGAIAVTYTTADGTGVAGADYTAASGTLQWAGGDAAAKTFSIAISNVTAFSGTKSFSVALSTPTGGAAIESPSSATITINGSTVAPPSSTFWVYHNGVFAWGGDYSTAGTPNYSSTAGAPESGTYDIAFKLTGLYGIWAPYAGGTVPMWNFNSTGYNYITMDLKPTVANQSWQFYFMLVGDKQIIGANGQQIVVNLANFGPPPVVGQWATYKIPLVDVLTQYAGNTPVYESSIYKFGLQDETGLSSNTWYIDNVGFTQQ